MLPALDRLADALVEDILSASDEDILAELLATVGDPERYAANMRARFEKNLLATNKGKLAAEMQPAPTRSGDANA